jgi:protein transport protein SEC24
MRGTVEFLVPKEYWSKEPVGLRWLFLIDVGQESFNKGFLEAFCEGVIGALYGEDELAEGSEEANGSIKRRIPPGAKVGFVTFDKDIHFYNINVSQQYCLDDTFANGAIAHTRTGPNDGNARY